MLEKVLHTEHGSVHYWVSEDTDSDKPWLAFLPGLTADHTLFDPQVDFFSERTNIFIWDAPGHGASRPFDLTFTLDDCARILHEIFEIEDITNPVLIGQSLGGYLSQAFMRLYPDAISGFISVDSASFERQYYSTWELWFLKHNEGMFAIIPWSLLLKWGPAGTALTSEGQANMRTMMKQYGHKGYVKLTGHGYRMLAEAIEADLSFEITCPTLLLCGENDSAGFMKKYSREWAKRSGLPLVWIPDAGHNSTIDNPGFVNEQIERFLKVNLS